MSRIRKGLNRYWPKEEKLKLTNEVLNGKSSVEVAKENDISGWLLRGWIIKYNDHGEDALINKKKLGNSLMKYSMRKELSDLENTDEITQKEFEIAKSLSKEYSIKSLCQIMNISRSGYYKWLKNKDIIGLIM